VSCGWLAPDKAWTSLIHLTHKKPHVPTTRVLTLRLQEGAEIFIGSHSHSLLSPPSPNPGEERRRVRNPDRKELLPIGISTRQHASSIAPSKLAFQAIAFKAGTVNMGELEILQHSGGVCVDNQAPGYRSKQALYHKDNYSQRTRPAE